MIGPHGAVLDMSILDCHVVGIGNVDEARALCILIGALAIPGAANPKFFPIVITIAIDDTRTPQTVKTQWSALMKAEKYLHVSPSIRVSMTGSGRYTFLACRLPPRRGGS